MLEEAAALSEMFHISLDDIRLGKITPSEIQFEKKDVEKVSARKPLERIAIPQEQVEKFKQVFLYLVSRIGGKPNIGQTALYKLLYFIDFDYYEKFHTQLIGARYIRNTHGPTPIIFGKVLKEMETEGVDETVKSKFYQFEQTKYLINPNIPLDISALSAQELNHINLEIDRLSDLTATQLSDLSHKDTPWAIAKEKDVLNYEHVFYRSEETSVGDYAPL